MQLPPQLSPARLRECSIAPVRRSLLVLLAAAAFPSSTVAAPVLVLGRDGRVTARNDPYVSGPAITPAPAGSAEAEPASRVRTAAATRRQRTVFSELNRMRRTGAISPAVYEADTAAYRAALTEEQHLS